MDENLGDTIDIAAALLDCSERGVVIAVENGAGTFVYTSAGLDRMALMLLALAAAALEQFDTPDEACTCCRAKIEGIRAAAITLQAALQSGAPAGEHVH